MEYYYIHADPTSTNNLRIMLSVLQGDVDLYISATWDTHPRYDSSSHNVVSYLYSSAKVGEEDFTISHNLVNTMCLNRCHCTLLSTILF